MEGVAVIDLEGVAGGDVPDGLARQVDRACRTTGFFQVVGHGVSPDLRGALDRAARQFFALPPSAKAEISMARGGRAWRGWFPEGGELTSGRPDAKEGLYFGQQLDGDDPRVVAGVPMHGPNLFPSQVPDLEPLVLEYLDVMTRLGADLLRVVARALGLDERWFADGLTADPLVLFRIFRYPPLDEGDDRWSVGPHTDYGLLTLLGHDGVGGLQVRGPHGWIDVPPLEDAFVVNLGDMLERMTGGAYRSTLHRVRNIAGVERISYPVFFDPGWDADVRPVPGMGPDPSGPDAPDAGGRWDRQSVHEWSGTYGDYVWAKVGRVFPELEASATGQTPGGTV